MKTKVRIVFHFCCQSCRQLAFSQAMATTGSISVHWSGSFDSQWVLVETRLSSPARTNIYIICKLMQIVIYIVQEWRCWADGWLVYLLTGPWSHNFFAAWAPLLVSGNKQPYGPSATQDVSLCWETIPTRWTQTMLWPFVCDVIHLTQRMQFVLLATVLIMQGFMAYTISVPYTSCYSLQHQVHLTRLIQTVLLDDPSANGLPSFRGPLPHTIILKARRRIWS